MFTLSYNHIQLRVKMCLLIHGCAVHLSGAYLVAGGAARLQPLRVVAPTVDLPILVKVDEVYQELTAHAAHKAGGVPTHAVTRP